MTDDTNSHDVEENGLNRLLGVALEAGGCTSGSQIAAECSSEPIE